MDPTLQLPEEVADMIFCLLPVKDLLSCSLVSSQWRDAVNKNRMWKPFCKLECDLEGVECTVSPRFALPPGHCEDLAPLCKYRQIYMREHHLRQNVIHNRWTKKKMMSGNRFRFQLNFLENFLIVARHPHKRPSRPMIIVMDMHKNMQEIDRTECLLIDRSINLLKVLESKIVVIQDDFLQLFLLDQGRLTLSICRVLVLDQAVSLTMPVIDIRSSSSRNELNEWYIKQQTCSTCRSSLTGKYCVTVATTQNSYDNYTLHFWEIHSGCRIKMAPVPGLDKQSSVYDIKTHVRGGNIYIVLYSFTHDEAEISSSIKVMSFRLERLGILEFCVDIPNSNQAYFAGIYVVIFPCGEDKTKYKIVDTTKGGAVLSRQVPHNISAVDIHGAQVVFASGTNVHLLNTETMQETVLSISAEDYGSIVNLYFINSEFFQVWKKNGFNVDTENWIIKNSCKLYSLRPTKYGLKEMYYQKNLFPKIYFISTEDAESWSIDVINYW